jgi:hypothetical protein
MPDKPPRPGQQSPAARTLLAAGVLVGSLAFVLLLYWASYEVIFGDAGDVLDQVLALLRRSR